MAVKTYIDTTTELSTYDNKFPDAYLVIQHDIPATPTEAQKFAAMKKLKLSVVKDWLNSALSISGIIYAYYYNGRFYTTVEHTTEVVGDVKNAYVDISANLAGIFRYVNNTYSKITAFFTDALKAKLEAIEAGAQKNVQSNFTESDSTKDSFILNKPTKLSDFTNDQGFITNTVNNLTNYYLKSETYTKTEVNNIVASIEKLTIQVVDVLPATGVANVIYLVPSADPATSNVKDEYLWINNAWEKIGSTAIDLSNYYTKSETNALVNAKYTKPADGIPKTDLTEAVQTSLGKADTALQEHQPLTAYRKSADQDVIDTGKVDKEDGKGLSENDYTDEEKAKVTANTSARHTHSNKAELDLIASGDKAKWDGKYSKPATGVPKSDLASDVQTSLGKADTALQEHQSLSEYRKSAAQDTIDAGKVPTSRKVNGHELSEDVTVTKSDVGLGNVDNTSDANKPISTATQSALDAITGKIPSEASTSNKLADKEFVNSSIATETAHYISNEGEPFTSVAALEAYTGTVTNNDYAFVSGTDATGNAYYDRYKATVPKPAEASSIWAKEFRLNNSSFTAAQWSAISSGITAVLVASYNAHIADGDIHVTAQNKTTWNGKQDALTNTDAEIQDAVSKKHEHSNKNLLDTYTQTEANLSDAVSKKHSHSNKSELDLIASGDKAKWDAKYNKPATGIPDTDLAEAHYTESEVDTLLLDKVSYQDIVGTTGQATNKAISQKKFTDDMNTKANAEDLTSHTGNTSNPHSVTKAQVGLGNVPNTDFTPTIADHETRISAIENSDSLIKVTAYHANAVISGLTVQVKQGSTVRYTGTTDSNGYCEIRVANGNYTIHGVYDADYTTVIDADVVAPKFGEVSCRIVGLKDGEMTWSLFQEYVQNGTIKSVLAIGDEVTVSRGNTDYTFQHVAFDKMTTAQASTHNSVIQMKDLYDDTIQFCPPQAFIYAQEEMPAGTYHVNLYKASSVYNLNAGLQNKDLQFTIAQTIPQGGQIVVTGGDFKNTTTVADLVLTSYSTKAGTIALETGIACSEGTSGTDLGSANTVANSGKINCTDRTLYGSNRWKTSAMRQWLNSDQPRGSWWTPMSNFDRRPSQADSIDGWLYGLNADLLSVIKPVKNIQVLNWFDGGINEETEDYFFVPSSSQVFGTATLTEGDCWDWYDSKANGGNSDLASAGTGADSNRIKKRNGSAARWWLRTPHSTYSYYEYGIVVTGTVHGSTGSAYNYNGGAPACVIA